MTRAKEVMDAPVPSGRKRKEVAPEKVVIKVCAAIFAALFVVMVIAMVYEIRAAFVRAFFDRAFAH